MDWMLVSMFYYVIGVLIEVDKFFDFDLCQCKYECIDYVMFY